MARWKMEIKLRTRNRQSVAGARATVGAGSEAVRPGHSSDHPHIWARDTARASSPPAQCQIDRKNSKSNSNSGRELRGVEQLRMLPQPQSGPQRFLWQVTCETSNAAHRKSKSQLDGHS
ncbi:uncharacterized protein LOC117584219 isoform X1 [Drosophila guanche]|uniref:uncharacterized protein LOC117584219 isoform X1 n=1 Tax=Drosophila guanche TaxID=7266 RepID=UPI001471BF62|nr:uncharacterized protein LOC117584219 isoform X1 [Drosophila guanche]